MAEKSLRDAIKERAKNPESTLRFCSKADCKNFFNTWEIKNERLRAAAEKNAPGTKYLCPDHSVDHKPAVLVSGEYQAWWAK